MWGGSCGVGRVWEWRGYTWVRRWTCCSIVAATTEMPPTMIWIGLVSTPRELLHRRGQGREEHRLSVGPRVADDPVDLRRESQIEHPISLVEHDVGDGGGW